MSRSTTPTAAQQQLADLRAEAAALAAQQASTDTAAAVVVRGVRLPEPGTLATVLVATSVDTGEDYPWTNVMARGAKFRITAGALSRARDRNGDPTGIALCADPEAQLRKWGECRFHVGELPSDFRPWRPGSPEMYQARWRAVDAAHALEDPDAKREALAAVRAEFGNPEELGDGTRYRGDGEHGTIPAAR